MGIFGRLAYEEGATVGTLLAVRFVLAAALLWLVAASSGGARRVRALPRRDVGIALVSTVGAVGLFFAGLQRVGPTAASILEPVVTVVLALLVFGESLRPVPLAGGALVLVAVLAVRVPVRLAVPGVRAGA